MDLFQIRTPGNGGFPSLRSRLTRDEAIEAFNGGLARRLIGRIRRDRFRAVAEVYVPYHLFRVEISDGRRHQTSAFAVDAVTGTLDLYRFAPGTTDLDLVSVHSRNRLAATVSAGDAWPAVADKLQRALFQTGFFRLRDLHLTGSREPIDLHLPYWVGFYEQGARLRLDVVDAVRGRIEGAKARALFENWLAGERERREPEATERTVQHRETEQRRQTA
jgi:hypothetical protein